MLIFLLFIISPFAAPIAYSFGVWNTKTLSTQRMWTQAILLSMYVAVLACTKELDGDFLSYQEDFLSVPKYGLFEFLFNFSKEPLYYAFEYISYYLFFGNWRLYVVCFTFINYILLSYAVITIGKRINANIRTVITALYIMAFFFQELAAAGNLVRQCLAQSLVVVFFVRLYVNNQKKWWIALCAICVHSSCLPMLGLGLIPMMRARFTLKSLIKSLAILSVFIFVFYAAGNSLSGIPFIGYIFSRATNSEQLLGQDSWQENVGLNLLSVILLAILAYMSYSIYSSKNRHETDKIIPIVNFNILLIISLIICDVIGAYFLLMRYFFYVYAFQNTLIVIYLANSRFTRNNIVRVSLIVIMIVYFLYNYTHNFFSYAPLGEAIFYPAPMHVF